MFALLKNHVIQEQQKRYIVIFISLSFALIPFYSQYGLSVAGQPLLLYAYLNILYYRQKVADYIIIFLFPFYSYFVLVGPFILFFLFTIMIIDNFWRKHFNLQFLFAILLLALTYFLIEYHFIYSIFIDKSIVSHRTVWERYDDFSILSNIRRTFNIFFHPQYHGGSFPTIVIMLSSIISFLLTFRNKMSRLNLLFIILSILLICILYGFYDWFVYYFGNIISVFKYYNFSRFTFMLSILWLLLFAINLKQIANNRNFHLYISLALLFQIGLTIDVNKEYKMNLKLLLGRNIEEPNYSEFFAEKLFSRIKLHINRRENEYRIINIGMHPSISQFNGFYTIDGYQNSYDLQYKIKFRQIIENEINKNFQLREYFDRWGNRCYLFVDELGKSFLYGKINRKEINNLQLNTFPLKCMGGEYILSAVKINNYDQNNLSYEGKFSDTRAYWDVYLYKIR